MTIWLNGILQEWDKRFGYRVERRYEQTGRWSNTIIILVHEHTFPCVDQVRNAGIKLK